MALTLTEINAYTLQYIVPKTTDVIFLNSPVFTRLHSRNMERFSGGLQIQRPIIVGQLNGGPLGRGDPMNIDFVTTDTALVVDMKAYYTNITLYGFDSMKNDGEQAVFSQVELKFQNASLTMAKLLATDMYLNDVAPRTKALTGFQQWYDDGNTYTTIGGILRSDVQTVGTVGGLNSYVATLTTFSLQAVNTAYGNAWFGNDHVDLIPATQNGWNLMWNAMQPLQRYYDKESDVGVAGFQSFRFNAAEVVVDKYMSTGTNGVMYGFNTKYIEWYFSTNPKFQFGFTGFKETNNTIDVAGQFLVGSNIVVPNPRSGFKLLSTLF
jgi:hypothetical protein